MSKFVTVADLEAARAKMRAVQSQAAANVSYEIVQDDMVVASASGERAHAEIMHYAQQYRQDGPIELFKVTRESIPAP